MKIRTSDEELYSKLKSLNYTDEVLIKGKKRGLSRIVKAANRKEKCLSTEDFGDRTIIKRLRPLSLNIKKIKR